MVSTVAGLELDPVETGYKKIVFKPRPGGTLTWAKATLETPQGKAGIHWQLKDEELHLELTVPSGSEAILSLADGWKSNSSLFTPGEHRVIARR